MGNSLFLACDVGGTNTSIGLMRKTAKGKFSLLSVQRYSSKNISNFTDTMKKALHSLQKQYQWETAPPLAVSASGPTDGKLCYPSNIENLKIVRKDLEAALGNRVLLINDFSAIAYSLMVLDTEGNAQVQQIAGPQSGRKKRKEEVKLVLGAGTGLGIAMLHIKNKVATLIPTEGGWRNFSPSSELSLLFYLYLSDSSKKLCCWEDALCGSRGIPSICNFFATANFALQHGFVPSKEEQLELRRLIVKYTATELPPVISALAHADNSACVKIMSFWTTLYAVCCSETATLCLPTGGLYIAGGIASKNLRFFTDDSLFYSSFMQNQNKEVQKIFKEIPLYVVTDYNASLYGNAFFLDSIGQL